MEEATGEASETHGEEVHVDVEAAVVSETAVEATGEVSATLAEETHVDVATVVAATGEASAVAS